MKTKQALMVWGPLALGAGLVVWLSVKNKKKMASAPVVGPGEKIPATLQVVTPVTSIEFPLRKGVNNAKVKELQKILGVTADGAFGVQTETALVNFASIRSVDSQEQLDQLKLQAAGVTNQKRALDLMSKFLNGGQAIYVLNTAPAVQVMEDAYGALIRTGRAFQFASGHVYNNTDYQLSKTTKGGNVLMNITSGDLVGTYEVNPNNITLKAI